MRLVDLLYETAIDKLLSSIIIEYSLTCGSLHNQWLQGLTKKLCVFPWNVVPSPLFFLI